MGDPGGWKACGLQKGQSPSLGRGVWGWLLAGRGEGEGDGCAAPSHEGRQDRFGVSPSQFGSYSLNPRLTKGHIWLQPVEENRQKLGVINSGAAQAPDSQQVPSGSASSPNPALHLTPPGPQVNDGSPGCPPEAPGSPSSPSPPPPYSLLPKSVSSRPLTSTVQTLNSPAAHQRHSPHCGQVSIHNLAGNPSGAPWGPDPQPPA